MEHLLFKQLCFVFSEFIWIGIMNFFCNFIIQYSSTVYRDHYGLGFLTPKYYHQNQLSILLCDIYRQDWLDIAKPKNVFVSTINLPQSWYDLETYLFTNRSSSSACMVLPKLTFGYYKCRASRSTPYIILCLECFPTCSKSWKQVIHHDQVTHPLLNERCTFLDVHSFSDWIFHIFCNDWIDYREILQFNFHAVLHL